MIWEKKKRYTTFIYKIYYFTEEQPRTPRSLNIWNRPTSRLLDIYLPYFFILRQTQQKYKIIL